MARRNKKRTNLKLMLILLLEIVVFAFLAIQYWISIKFDKIKIHHIDESMNAGANPDQEEYLQIAIFGIDARDNDNLGAGNRSDTIMIASINKNTNEVKIVSVYRDTLLNVDYDGGITTKATHAYAYGGPDAAVKMLNENLDLNITEFVTVNFMALTKAIDRLGGVEIDVEEEELPVLNTAIAEQVWVTGIYSDGVFTTGRLTLNGTQATAYSRIRSTGMGDITRTERQREVVQAMISKIKSSDLSTVNALIDDVFPCMYTSIDKKEMLELAKTFKEYELTENSGFPFNYTPINHASKGSILVAKDLSTNVTMLHSFLFGTVDYRPTDVVNRISSTISNETSVYPE